MVPVIVGPTAAGKSALAMRLATTSTARVEIVSADSRQIYRGMDIGTAKTDAADRAAVVHHLIDIVTPDVLYSAGRFADEARRVIRDIVARGAVPLVVGGSGFYVRALFEGLSAPPVDPAIIARLEERIVRDGYDALVAELAAIDPEAATAHAANNRVKTIRALACFEQTGVRYSAFEGPGALGRFELAPSYLAVAPERAELYRRVDVRAEAMLAQGLVDETRGLLAAGYPASAPGLRTVGYREVIAHLDGLYDRATMLVAIRQSTRRYAKRQMTWFRRVEGARWIDPTADDAEARARDSAGFEWAR